METKENKLYVFAGFSIHEPRSLRYIKRAGLDSFLANLKAHIVTDNPDYVSIRIIKPGPVKQGVKY